MLYHNQPAKNIGTSPIALTSALVNPSTVMRDLEVFLTNDLDMSTHVNLLFSRCFYQLRRALPLDEVKTLVNSFVVSRLDCCSALLAGSTLSAINKQQVLNVPNEDHLRRKQVRSRRSTHLRKAALVTHSRENYPTNCLYSFKATREQALHYILDFCQPVS